MVGQTISHYRITEKLGEGGMGVVYKAEDLNLGRAAALKFLTREALGDERHRERFLREAKAAASLNHPNVCTVYGIHVDEEQPFLAMEFVDGEDVKRKVDAGPLDVDTALDIAGQAGLGLQAAHEKGVVHRDIKSANLMVTKQGYVKVADFGLALVADWSRRTQKDQMPGTPAYMSPEQAMGEAVDRRTDIWALGVVLYEMVTGRLPFEGEYQQAVLYGVINEQQKPMTALRVDVPIELDRIVAKALAKDPGDRYQQVEEMLVDLRVLRREGQSGSSPTIASRTISRVAPKPTHRLQLGTYAAAGALALAVMAAVWWFNRDSGPSLSTVPQYKLTQLTRDSGYSGEPAISPDGTRVAFVSNRSGGNNTDIWLQQIDTGDAIQLTTHEADDLVPSFSPDGSKVVFWSFRDGGRICVVSVLTKRVQVLAEKPFNYSYFDLQPRFSPDGGQVALSHRGEINIVPATGGIGRSLETGLEYATAPVWSPDGRYMLFRAGTAPRSQEADWYVIPSVGGEPVPMGALAVFGEAGLVDGHRYNVYEPQLVPSAWLHNPDRIIFAASSGDTCNIYEIAITPGSWQVASPPRQLTQGPAESLPSVSTDGRIAYMYGQGNRDIWSVAIDSNAGKQLGEPKPVIQTTSANEMWPSWSADGTRLVWVSDRSGNMDVWKWDSDNRTPSQLTVTPNGQEDRALISPDGETVVFIRRGDGAKTLHAIPFDGGLERELVDGGPGLLSWSGDSKRAIYHARVSPAGDPAVSEMFTVDVGTGDIRTLSKEALGAVNPSPDGRWLAFNQATTTSQASSARQNRLHIAPVRNGVAAPREDWIQMTETRVFYPWWSRDGNLIYFLSQRHGFRCVFAVRIDPSSGQRVG